MTGKKKLKKDTSRVVRISAENYDAFTDSKRAYASKLRLPKVTYDEFLTELLRVANLLLNGEEVYAVGGKTFEDLSEARGAAITDAVRSNVAPQLPEVFIRLGKDDGISGWPK